jgi:hypothetical protein
VCRVRSFGPAEWLSRQLRILLGNWGEAVRTPEGGADLKAYVDAVDAHFANQIHFAQLIKLYSSPDITGPDWFGASSRVTGTIPSVKTGRPDPCFVSTSHVERVNLSVRMHLRRYARRTNAHSRKLANHKGSV